MKPSQNILQFIASFEGLRLDAYVDPGTGAEPITIGYGTTIYDDGKKVHLGDTITKERAEQLLEHEVNNKAQIVSGLTQNINLTQSQFDSLVSFTYNVGVWALQKSTLLKKVLANPHDPSIKDQFLRWNRSGGKIMKGLTKRREREAQIYFS